MTEYEKLAIFEWLRKAYEANVKYHKLKRVRFPFRNGLSGN